MPANYAGILSTPDCDLVGLGVGLGWEPEILTGSQSEPTVLTHGAHFECEAWAVLESSFGEVC